MVALSTKGSSAGRLLIKKGGDVIPAFRKDRQICLFGVSLDDGLHHGAGAEAAGAHVDGAHGAVGVLMADSLQVGIEATLGLDIGMAHKVAHLSFLAADFTLFTHGISSIKKPVWGGMLLKFDTFCIVRTASNSLYLKKRQVETAATSGTERS